MDHKDLTNYIREKADRFETWAIVQMFGHETLAGRVTEVTIAEYGFLRIDVPAVGKRSAFTEFINPKAIYDITPCDEDAALLAANEFSVPLGFKAARLGDYR